MVTASVRFLTMDTPIKRPSTPKKPSRRTRRPNLLNVGKKLDFSDLLPPTPPKAEVKPNELSEEDRALIERLAAIDCYLSSLSDCA